MPTETNSDFKRLDPSDERLDWLNVADWEPRGGGLQDAHIHLLNGLSLVGDPLFLLVTDSVHPNDAGMHRNARGVAAALKPILAGLG